MRYVIIMSKGKSYLKTSVGIKEDSFLKTIHEGFNYFHQIDLPSRKRPHLSIRRKRAQTTLSDKDDHSTLRGVLEENKINFARIQTEMSSLRQSELSQYVKKSMKYQELLNLNDNKRKRLPTFNSKIGEVVKKSAVEHTAKNVEYTIISTHLKLQGWRPQSREGHTATVYRSSAVIIGGHCSAPYFTAQVYSFERQAWVKQLDVSPGRSYHTSLLYKGRFIIVFGGMGAYDVSRRCRVCSNAISLVDLQTWTTRALKMSNQETIEGRRSHGAVLMGKYMLIFGGMNTKRQFLGDLAYLDLKQLRWYHKEFKAEGKELSEHIQSGIAKHKMVTHFKNHKTYPLYSSEYSDTEGLLIFGGTFGNGQQNILLFMGFNKYNPHLKRVEYSGLPPSSLQPIVERINQNSIVIISGELSDRNIKLYRIRQRQFVGIYKFTGGDVVGGIGSSLCKYEDETYIFFGLAKKGYLNGISSFRVQEKVVQNEMKKKKQRVIDFEEHLQHESIESQAQSSLI